jgi:hypothetical protein
MALPSNDKIVGDSGHTEDHNAIVEINIIKNTYLPASASSNYLTISSSSNFLPVSSSSNFLPTSASFDYLRIDTASSTYLRQDTASAIYLRKDTASSIYAANLSELNDVSVTSPNSGEYLKFNGTSWISASIGSTGGSASSVEWSNVTNTPTTLAGYGITDALPSSASSNYLPVSASSNYLPVSASINYLRTDNASATYSTKLISTNGQTGTSYVIALSDADKLITMNNANANTIIIPTNASVAFPIGTKIDFIQTGVGATSASPTSGVTLNSDTNKRTINAQWTAASLIKLDTDTWVLIGAIKA